MPTDRLSLAQQIALLEEAAPVDLDPEDVYTHVHDAEDTAVDSAAREHYLEVGPSALRKQHDSISNPKYDGVKRTRKQLMEGSEVDTEGEEEESEGSFEEVQHEASSARGEGEEGSPLSEVEEEGSPPIQSGTAMRRPANAQESIEEPIEDLSSDLQKKRAEDRRKGQAISRQIALWDSLLDARIRLQKSLTAANRLPKPLELKEIVSLPGCQDAMNKMLRQAISLSDEIFELQEVLYLLASNELISAPPRKRQKIQSEDEAVGWFQDAATDLSTLEETYHPHFVQTLAKWSAKIQAIAPSALLPSSRNSFSSRSAQHTKSVLQLIDETLVDHHKILARTQVRRGKTRRIGVSTESMGEQDQEVDPETFDDTDFYQQLLRNVIDARGNAVGDDWISVQKQKKAKKRVDTKASKGRKLRYEPHEKLQNFMVPVPAVGSWHEEQIDELFASLLGKGFENAMDQNDEEVQMRRRLDEEIGDSLKGSFKVFG